MDYLTGAVSGFNKTVKNLLTPTNTPNKKTRKNSSKTANKVPGLFNTSIIRRDGKEGRSSHLSTPGARRQQQIVRGDSISTKRPGDVNRLIRRRNDKTGLTPSTNVPGEKNRRIQRRRHTTRLANQKGGRNKTSRAKQVVRLLKLDYLHIHRFLKSLL